MRVAAKCYNFRVKILRSTRNAWIQVVIFVAVIFLGLYYKISQPEWAMIILAAGLVIGAEAFNMSHHVHTERTKHFAAATVLIAVTTATIVGICIFSTYL
jgi:diacylglycerol kinase